MNTITIECKNISKHFGEGARRVDTLRDINFVAHEREMIMLMGPSGSGKTTLISIIGGIMNADSGYCTILDTHMEQLTDAERTRFRGKRVGFIFQIFNLVPTISPVDNVAIPLLLNGYAKYEAYQKAERLLLDMGLNNQRHVLPNELSGGEQQRVAIARACIHQPKIILCDEPTSFLDLQIGKKIMQLLVDIKNKNNCTIIVVTHDPRILPFADRILEIEDGVIKREEQAHQKTLGSANNH